jgi:methyl coenzyme M reductase beta subunit
MTKLLFVAGLGTGFVLGSRAGRERYEQIRSTAQSVWESPAVQQAVMGRMPDVPELIGRSVTALLRSVFSTKKGRSRRAARKMTPATPAPAGR